MTSRCEARLDVLLDALCALVEALPPEAKPGVGLALAQRVASISLADEGPTQLSQAMSPASCRRLDVFPRWQAGSSVT